MQFRAEEARAAPDIKDALTRRGGQERANEGAPSNHVADAIQSLQLLASLLVKHSFIAHYDSPWLDCLCLHRSEFHVSVMQMESVWRRYGDFR